MLVRKRGVEMRKLFSKKVAIATVVFVVASAIAISALALSQRRRMAPPTASSKDPRTLEEKAKRGGGKIIANLDFNKGAQQTSLSEMVATSESIVVATTDSNVCRLSEEGKVIRTLYRVRVD
jgi:cytoskeletal protein RodZ